MVVLVVFMVLTAIALERAVVKRALQAEEDGLDIVKRMLRDAPTHLAPDGNLIVEVGNSAHLLQETYPEIPFTWLEFERGGSGVFLLSAEALKKFAGNI